MVTAAIAALPLIVNAQSAPSAAPTRAESPPPPETVPLEEGSAPDITIKQPDTKKKITEKKVHGKVTEVKVQTGRTTYYAHPNDPAGSAMRGDTQSQSSQPVQFRIGEFGAPDTSKKTHEPVDALPPAPPK
jgi:hypothetical protein